MIRLIALMLVMYAVAPAPSIGAEVALETDDQKTLYAMGLLMAQQLVGYDITQAELDIINAGLSDGVMGGEGKVALDEFGPKIQEMLTPRAAAVAERETKASVQFIAEEAKRPGATTTETGVIYIEETAGTGETPAAAATVKLHYHGTLRDGTVFDSSKGGEPAEFALDRVIPCFGAGIQKMKVGGKSKLICPADQAYGDRGAPPKIRPGAALVFELELLEIVSQTPVAAHSNPVSPH